jgi:hypothetical protein
MLNEESNAKIKIDFGSDEINKIYNELDDKTKNEIDELPKLEIKIRLLKDISNKDLQLLYNNLNSKEKAEIGSFNVRDKYAMLRYLLKKKNKEQVVSQYLKPDFNPVIVEKDAPEELLKEDF